MAAIALQYADIYVALASQEMLNWKRVAVIHYIDDVMISVR